MRTRFMTSDDSWDNPESDEAIDLSGFITSSETQPVVVERRRKASSIGSAPSMADGMTNAGPTTVPPPPMSNVGYGIRITPEFKEGSPGNSFSAPETSNYKPFVHFVPWHVHDNTSYPWAIKTPGKGRKKILGIKLAGATTFTLGYVIQRGVLQAARQANAQSKEKIFKTPWYNGAGFLKLAGGVMYITPTIGWQYGFVASSLDSIKRESPNSAWRSPLAKGIIAVPFHAATLKLIKSGLDFKSGTVTNRVLFQGGEGAGIRGKALRYAPLAIPTYILIGALLPANTGA